MTHGGPPCPGCSQKPCLWKAATAYFCTAWRARSLFPFVGGSPEGHAANKQTCTILLQLISEERTKSLAICAGVIKQCRLAGSQRVGGRGVCGGAAGCSGLGGADADFLVWGTTEHWQRSSGWRRASCPLECRSCPIPPSHSELYCGCQSSQMN